MCFLLVNLKLYREIYPNYSLVFKKKKKKRMNHLIPLSAKAEPAKNSSST